MINTCQKCKRRYDEIVYEPQEKNEFNAEKEN